MPEGPEVRVVADAIEKGIGEVFEAAEVIENVLGTLHRYSKKPIPNWEHLQEPWVLQKVWTKGKLIIFEIEVIRTKKMFWILSTLGMSGDWRWNSAGHKHCRLAFIRQRGDLSFVDVRCFGTVRVVTADEMIGATSKIGWDLLAMPAPKQIWRNIRTLAIRHKPVGEALLEQKYFSGIGNIYKAEILYALRIDPTIKVADLTDHQWESINTTAHGILLKAYKLRGSSIVDFTADGVEGEAQHMLKIYGKSHCPKGHTVATLKQGKGSNRRTTWWCPTCVKEYGTISRITE